MGFLARTLTEQRVALTYQAIWGADLLTGMTNTAAGQKISQETAFQETAVFACVRLLADSVATLPVGTYRRVGGALTPAYPRPGWLDTPIVRDPSMTRIDHFTQVVYSLLLDGNSFTLTTRAEPGGDVVETIVLNPRAVDIRLAGDGVSPIYTWRGPNGTIDNLGPDDILHIPLLRIPGKVRGVSPVEQNKEALGLTKVAEQFVAKFFGQGATLSGLITTDADMTQDDADMLRDKFESRHAGAEKSHRTGVLTGGAKYVANSIPPDQSFIELRRFQLNETARVFRVPPHLIQDTQPGAVSYASVEAQAIEFVVYGVRPLLERIEAGYQRIVPGQSFMRFTADGLLRGDIKTRYEAHAIGINAGFILRSDARSEEDFAPVPGLDVPLTQLNVAAAPDAVLRQRFENVRTLVWAGFDPTESVAAAGLPPIQHTGLPPRQLQPAIDFNPVAPWSEYPQPLSEDPPGTPQATPKAPALTALHPAAPKANVPAAAIPKAKLPGGNGA